VLCYPFEKENFFLVERIPKSTGQMILATKPDASA